MSKKILVIEHDPLLRNFISQLLAQRGYEVNQAASRVEAVGLLSRYAYDLILLDLMMPEDNGFCLLEQIRSEFPHQSRHTIPMTSSDPKFLARLPDEGWCAVLTKPLVLGDFYRVVDLCMGGTHTAGVQHHQ
jgi:CheY-like chemotaxis protein